MTVRYARDFATNTSLGAFTKLLFRWRGSVYKLIWAEYLVFISLYTAISLLYRFGLNPTQQEFFEKIVNFCERYGGSLQMSFVLGFFVTSIVSKWWQLYTFIPWPDSLALRVNAHIKGQDEYAVRLRKTIMRYCNLNLMLTFRHVSPRLKRGHPTLSSLITEGLLTEKERLILDDLMDKSSDTLEWLPISWAVDLLVKAQEDGILKDSNGNKIMDDLDKFRHGCALILEYERFTVPLVYVQVVTISVYTYFLACLFGGQWLLRDAKVVNLDLYFPFFTTLKFLFYMGWLKVAESLINPFGCDDDDFELEEILDRHRRVSYMMVNCSDTMDSPTTPHLPSPHHPPYSNQGFPQFPLKDPFTATPSYISRSSPVPQRSPTLKKGGRVVTLILKEAEMSPNGVWIV